ncbi:MAG: hypothetical protein M3144_11770 [Actinomycetota bacterium]|nr:hypothetical protein [Actinomycetota bacterium]
MTGYVSVRGAGIGSLTAASVLSSRGWHVEVRDVPRRPPPALVLNEITRALLGDVFGPDLLIGGHALGDRRVRWGPASTEVCVPTASVAIEGGVLLDRLRRRVTVGEGTEPAHPADWVIDGTGRSGAGPRQRRAFGRRSVIQAEVSLAEKTPSRSSWVETVDDGWVHVAPVAASRAVVQAMVPVAPADPASTLEGMAAATKNISRQIGGWRGNVSLFPAAPTLAVPLCGPGWLAVADAAVSIDPLSGSGTAWAVRGGILAAAVIDAVRSGQPEDECLRHYADRLHHALADHVARCLDLYRAAFSTLDWREELAIMASTMAALGGHRSAQPFTYRLNGFRLERPADRLIAPHG